MHIIHRKIFGTMKTKQFINFIIFSNLSVQFINLSCIITVLSIIYSKQIINWERGNSNMAFKH